MPLIKSIKKNIDLDDYPFSIKSFKKLDTLDSNHNLIVLVGENGSGKSTLLKIIAAKLNLYRISKDLNYNDKEFIKIKKSLKHFEISYTIRPKGFFFRSEDFITYRKYLEDTKSEAINELSRIDEEYKGKSNYSKNLARMPHIRNLDDLNTMYNNNLLELSHGESYLDFFKS